MSIGTVQTARHFAADPEINPGNDNAKCRDSSEATLIRPGITHNYYCLVSVQIDRSGDRHAAKIGKLFHFRMFRQELLVKFL